MSAAIHNLKIEQGSTFPFQMKFVKDGQTLDITQKNFKGSIKSSVYDSTGYDFRFDKIDYSTVNVYLDAEVSSQIDFTKGVYDIVMEYEDSTVYRLAQGTVDIDLGVTLWK